MIGLLAWIYGSELTRAAGDTLPSATQGPQKGGGRAGGKEGRQGKRKSSRTGKLRLKSNRNIMGKITKGKGMIRKIREGRLGEKT
jgi:hypothetical protein